MGHDHVPRYRRPYAEGDLIPRPTHHEDQDHRTTREEILRLDRRIHLGIPLHLPTDVDQQTRIRRIWSINCPPKMLLSCLIHCLCRHDELSLSQDFTVCAAA